MIRCGLNIFGWAATIVSAAIVLGLIGLMIYINSEMSLVCGRDGGYYHSGECKDLGSLGGVTILAVGFFLLLASIRPVIYFVMKARQED
ncbi:MAG: hypothetical protein ABJO57_13045 [Lentilitoribacter sp.]